MRVFLSYRSHGADIANRISRSLEDRCVEVLTQSRKSYPGEPDQDEWDRAMAGADALVFLIDEHASLEDPKLASEWRSALRAEWDSDNSKPMIPLAIGNASLPPFLSDREPLRIDRSHFDSMETAGAIVRAAESPAQPISAERRAEARAQQRVRLEALKHFADTLSAESLAREATSSR